jgi:hypothetical protein
MTKKEKIEYADIFQKEYKMLEKSGFSDLKARALFDEIAEEWIVVLYFKRAGRLQSVIPVLEKGEAEAKEIEEFFNDFIE